MKTKTLHFILSMACFFCLAIPFLVFASELDEDDLSLYFSDDEMVEAVSRYPKPLSQVAENVTIISAEEIEQLHAHTLADVFKEVPSLFLSYEGQEAGSGYSVNLQGSRSYHTLFLIDGVRYNNASGGDPLTGGLPVGIIKRIEVIKGPVSSSWGSSLGGVINVITKDTGKSTRPVGQVSASYGESATQQYNGQVTGRVGKAGYYLYSGYQKSDGHWRDRYSDNHALYAKLTFDLPQDMGLGMTVGYSDPYRKILEFPGQDYEAFASNRSTFATIYFDAPINKELDFHLAFRRFTQDYTLERDVLGLGVLAGSRGDQYWDDQWSEHSHTFSGRLVWHGKKNSAVIGAETRRGVMDYFYDWVPGGPFHVIFLTGREEQRGVYANASLNWGNFSFSPGLRYDYNSSTNESWSPSLGATYRLNEDTIFRASVGRGFKAPDLAYLYGLQGNRQLKPEIIWTYQAGAETKAVPYLNLSGSFFFNRSRNVWDNSSGTWENAGRIRRKGLELEAKTIAWRHLSLIAKGSMSSEDRDGKDNDTWTAANLIALYDNPDLFTARLSGRYLWWADLAIVENPDQGDVVWQLNLSKRLQVSEAINAEAFAVFHNLFNAAQYWDFDYRNPDRWFEAGLTFRF